MMAGTTLSRRECLALLAALVSSGVASPGLSAAERAEGRNVLERFCREPRWQSTRVAGKAFLEAHPDEGDLGQLVDRLLEGYEPLLALDTFLDLKVRTDFAKGETVRVANWLLSKTEGRLYAAVALLAG